MSKELHCLAQGCPGVTKGTLTQFFTSHTLTFAKIPQDRTVTYASVVIDHRLNKEDPNHVCITVGGNLIDYPFELTTRTANMVSSKIVYSSQLGAALENFETKLFY